MRQTRAGCSQIELIGDRVRVHLESDLVPAPGQFVLARWSPTFDPYLRQPLFASSLADSAFTVDLAASDPMMQFVSPGAAVDLIGPCGAAAAVEGPQSAVALIADSDPSPLLPFANRAIASGGAATLLIGQPYPLDALDRQIEVRVGDLLALAAEAAAADQVYIHAVDSLYRPLRQTLADHRVLLSGGFAQALVARPMPCGVGACGACAVKTGRGWKYACTDGPFFELADVAG